MNIGIRRSKPIAERRKLALEAYVIAIVAKKPIDHFAIRKAIENEDGFEWATPNFIYDTVSRLCHSERLIRLFPYGRSILHFALPEDPAAPIQLMRSRHEPNPERERRIIASLNWPKFFHVPSEEELAPRRRIHRHHERPIHL
jgi:hypothetical protein